MFAEILPALKKLEGSAWKEVQGELHSQYNEMPVWVLLYEDGDPLEAWASFRDAVAPYLDKIAPLQLTASFSYFEGDKEVHVEFLQDSQAVMHGPEHWSFGEYASSEPRRDVTIFSSRNSKRE
ncbi:MAG: hypothetical protein ACR2OX_00455 [Methyloligellaceae bacterium]